VTAITIHAINDAIATTLSAATGLVATRTFDQLKEGVNDNAILEVYFQRGTCDAKGGWDRASFPGAAPSFNTMRIVELVFYADLYAHIRSDLGENMADVVRLTDAVWDTLEAQRAGNLYALEGIRAHHWTVERVQFERPAGSGIRYMGVRFTITVRIF
jgi:hypothetical protein